MKEKKNKFHWRGFTSFFITLLGLISGISGIILYIVPPGRVAYWTNWTLWGLDKSQWEAVHTISSFLLVIFVVLHFYYNWKIFLGYLRTKFKKGLRLKKEFAVAVILAVIVTAGSIAEIPPFSTIMDFGEQIKESWGKKSTQAPIPHAELLTLKELSEKTGISYEKAIKKLKDKNIKFELEDKLVDIAEKNNTSPDRIYEIIVESEKISSEHTQRSYRGYGQLSIKELCEENGIEVSKCIEIFRKKGIIVSAEDNVRDSAIKYNMRPYELAEIISEVKDENKEDK